MLPESCWRQESALQESCVTGADAPGTAGRWSRLRSPDVPRQADRVPLRPHLRQPAEAETAEAEHFPDRAVRRLGQPFASRVARPPRLRRQFPSVSDPSPAGSSDPPRFFRSRPGFNRHVRRHPRRQTRGSPRSSTNRRGSGDLRRGPGSRAASISCLPHRITAAGDHQALLGEGIPEVPAEQCHRVCIPPAHVGRPGVLNRGATTGRGGPPLEPLSHASRPGAESRPVIQFFGLLRAARSLLGKTGHCPETAMAGGVR